MNYKEFITEIETRIKSMVPANLKISVQTIRKNNGLLYDGLVISDPAVNISPTIYLNPYYHRYLNGVSISDILEDILTTYQTHLPKQDFDISRFTDFSKAKNKIIMKIIHYERNKEFLETVPHLRYLDLAVIFQCLLDDHQESFGTITIHHEHCKIWDTDADTLAEIAIENTPSLLPHTVENMSHFLMDYHIPSPPIPMYILSNRYKVNGASVLLYDGVLSELAQSLGDDLVIIPSSIHEVLIIPRAEVVDLESYSLMIQEINETQLADEEILSDHTYVFSREENCLRPFP